MHLRLRSRRGQRYLICLPPHLPSPWVEPLSQRELEVLQLVAQGLSNREISERLFLSVNTVKAHNLRIFSRDIWIRNGKIGLRA
ncbi:MAG: winged helix-turn-helix transcriptional regulator [Chloroflexi bacterium]|nr:winged helix-turn-helix transcriptional regulator [Chloroflexota bacterium]